MFIAVVLLTMFDLVTSYIGLSNGYMVEGNPIMRMFIDSLGLLTALGLVAIYTAICITIIGLLWEHRIARVGFIIILGVKIFAAVSHLSWIL